MRFSPRTLPKWLTHLSLTGIALVSLAATTYADPSSALHQSPHSQVVPHSGNQGIHYSHNSATRHLVRYEGQGSAHGSPHQGMGRSGHGTSPHGGGHPGGKVSGHSAHNSGHPGPHQSASEFIGHVLKFKDGMGITDQQESDLRALETQFKKTQIKLKAAGDLANLDLHELLRTDDASMSDIETKLKNVHQLRANLYLASIKTRRDAKAVLSKEQRSRMKTIHERIKNHGTKMKGYSRGKSPHGDMPKHGG